MVVAPLPENEPARLKALAACSLDRDLPNDASLERFVNAVACALDVPIALISIVQRDRQFFAARVGLDVSETSRDVSFCAHAIALEQPLVVANALEDARFAENPLVSGPPHIRFYAGVPLYSPQGPAVGTLCVIDREPRTLAPHELGILQNLARVVEQHIELRSRADQLTDTLDQRTLGAAVHDLKGPLTAIQGISELIREDPSLASEDHGLVHDLCHSVSRLQHQLFDLLDTLTASHETEVVKTRLALEPLVERVVQDQRYRAERRGKRIEVRGAMGALEVEGHAPTLERCLYNLIDNALKHTEPQGTVTVELRAGSAEATLAVLDRGPGVPATLRQSIFEPGIRADSPRTGSVGLGLTSVRLGVERHGGTVRVSDRDGGGACFEMLLPLARAESERAS